MTLDPFFFFSFFQVEVEVEMVAGNPLFFLSPFFRPGTGWASLLFPPRGRQFVEDHDFELLLLFLYFPVYGRR